MAQFVSSFERITFGERILLGLNFVALIVRYWFHYEATLFLEIFAFALTFLYLPFGFYSIGKPGKEYTYTTGIILGLIYALGIISLLISAANIGSYRYPLIADFFILLIAVLYLVFKMQSDKYPEVFINAQFIRVGYIILCGLVILLK
ncbi:hypothetical protein HDF18_14520 [Mucilaginibacter sp. X5P1]|uniref:hypothetical protein n=1 Tax=Mucilaginibacter sp. X5P1 TaxID=2723088 RepID=UPI001619CBAD|nr:hypothetical protein [Mucilaginibacter sp. X5P1]MBB6138820.1 hypothetical protein [Mucilaginibacter sp. X5P1]